MCIRDSNCPVPHAAALGTRRDAREARGRDAAARLRPALRPVHAGVGIAPRDAAPRDVGARRAADGAVVDEVDDAQ
eukprot:2860032-Prymnesium_polylepis.1